MAERNAGHEDGDEEGGDSACWLDRVCPECGRIPDDGTAVDPCPYCGTPRRG